MELEIGLMELGIGLRISNARRTVLARESGLVPFFFHFFNRGSLSCWSVGLLVGHARVENLKKKQKPLEMIQKCARMT